MLQVAAGRRVTAALAAAVLSLCHGHALAQDDPDPYGELDAPLDPSAPLAPMPDLGVPWPAMEEETGEDIADAPDTNIDEAGGERTYSIGVVGRDGGNAEGLLAPVAALSPMEATRDGPSNTPLNDMPPR